MDDVTHSGADVCHRCARRRCERREVLAELLETEVRYGRDLRVLQDELYKPLLVAGLVPLRQLGIVFHIKKKKNDSITSPPCFVSIILTKLTDQANTRKERYIKRKNQPGSGA